MRCIKRMISWENGLPKRKKKGANDQEVANVEEVSDVVHVEKVAGESSTSTPGSAFLCRQSLHRIYSRVDLHLPKSPNKKAEIIQRLATKYKLRIDFQENRGRPRKELNEEKKIWLIEFLDRSDISYTNPGRKNHIYIGMFDGESEQCLL